MTVELTNETVVSNHFFGLNAICHMPAITSASPLPSRDRSCGQHYEGDGGGPVAFRHERLEREGSFLSLGDYALLRKLLRDPLIRPKELLSSICQRRWTSQN